MEIIERYSALHEYNPLIIDQYKRTPPYISGNKNIFEPHLSRHLYNVGFRPKYKDDKKYAICFSHDIDFIYESKNKNSFFISLVGSAKKRQLKKVIYNAGNLIKKIPNPNWVLDRLIDVEYKYGIKSSYFFLCLKEGEQDFNYRIETLSKYIDTIKAANCEIGLHGGHDAFNNPKKISEEKQILELIVKKNVVGYRNHYLRFKTPDTWLHLHKLGFLYDTTFGYPDLVGYRNGLCYPFRPYNIFEKCFIDIIEIPLIVMDVTFFKYMNLNVDNAWTLFNKILDDIKSLNGVITIVWHNNCLDGEHGILYEKIIKKLTVDDEAWVTTSAELAEWWKENNMAKMEEIILSDLHNNIA